MQNKLYQAYQYMIDLIASGMEYPDAHTKAAIRFNVDGDDLSEMYDKY